MEIMNKVDEIIIQAEKNCKEHGSRLTAKRKQVLFSLIQSGKALSAYDLIDLFEHDFNEKISAMSAYRILNFLESESLVHKLNLANKYIACAHITCDHAHGVPQFLICVSCNDVKEIKIKKTTIDELKQSVEEADFQLISPQLEMNCICNTCSEKTAE